MLYGLGTPYYDPTERSRQEVLEDFEPDQCGLHDLDPSQRLALIHHRQQPPLQGASTIDIPTLVLDWLWLMRRSPADAIAKTLVASGIIPPL